MTRKSHPEVSIGRIYKPIGAKVQAARNWQRYNQNSDGETGLKFEEGVDAYVPIVGSVRSTWSYNRKIEINHVQYGITHTQEFADNAVLQVSEQSFVEGGTQMYSL